MKQKQLKTFRTWWHLQAKNEFMPHMIKLRDGYFGKALNSKDKSERIRHLLEVVLLSKKIREPSNKHKIWISRPAWDEANDEETFEVIEVY